MIGKNKAPGTSLLPGVLRFCHRPEIMRRFKKVETNHALILLVKAVDCVEI